MVVERYNCDSAPATGSRKDNIIFQNALTKFLSEGKQNTTLDMLPFIVTVENMVEKKRYAELSDCKVYLFRCLYITFL